MNLKRYSNEIVVALALLLMIGSYVYKNDKVSQQTKEVAKVGQTLGELKEIVSLEKIWGGKKIAKKVNMLKNIVSPSKVTWSKKQNKVTASYATLSANEFNKLMTKILNLPVSITLLDVKKLDSNYNVELKCKW